MSRETESNFQYEILAEVTKAFAKVISVEGKIKKIYNYGHQITIKFENGNTYRQELITKIRPSNVTLD